MKRSKNEVKLLFGVLVFPLVPAFVFFLVFHFLAFRASCEPDAKEGKTICLVKGMQMDEKDMKEKYSYKGKTYRFCSKEAKNAFVKNPKKYLNKTFVCPIDGMKMKLTDAADAVEYEGKMIYFCMPGEKEKFLKSPEKYIKKKAETPTPKTKKMDDMEMEHPTQKKMDDMDGM